MFNDDNHNDNEQKPAENAQNDQAEAETEGEKKLGKVIPFNPTNEEVIQQANEEILEPAKAAATDAAQSLKAAFEDFKKQLAPLKDSLKQISDALKAGTKAVEKNAEPKAADEAKDENKGESKEDNQDDAPKAETAQDEAKADTPDDAKDKEVDTDSAAAAAAREAGEIVTLGIDKLKEQVAKAKFDFKGTMEREFANYADANLKEDEYTVDADGRRVVKVDGKFFQEHANEVIPALIKGTVGSFFKAFLGEDLIKVAEEKEKEGEEAKADGEATADGEAKADAGEPKADGEAQEKVEKEPSKYKVEFDFSRALGDAIRNAEVSPAAKTDEQKQERAVGRELLIESAKIVEDSLNGKPVDDAKERIEEVAGRMNKPDAEKAPEDIEAVDEKHRKILELSKQFEKNMNPDK